MKGMILVLGLTFSLFSCSSSDENFVCASFDTRQCMGDDWATVVDINGSEAEQSAQLKAFYAADGITLEDVQANKSFHVAVCEACFICPHNPRFTVKASSVEIDKLALLELLNFSTEDCSNF